MRRLSANYIFPMIGTPLRNGYIELSDGGEVISVGKLEKETESTEFYNGILCPRALLTHPDLPEMPLEELLPKICCGTFKEGSRSGVTLIDKIDFGTLRTTSESAAITLI